MRNGTSNILALSLKILALRLKKIVPSSTQMSTKFILLINVKMPIIVGILTFISMINTASERLKPLIFSFVSSLVFNEQLNELSMEKVVLPRGLTKSGLHLCCMQTTKVHTRQYHYYSFMRFYYEPVHEISNNVVCATSKASDQPAPTSTRVKIPHCWKSHVTAHI